MKDKITKSDQAAARVAAADVNENQSFWDRVQDQWEKMTSGPDIRPRQEQRDSRTQ